MNRLKRALKIWHCKWDWFWLDRPDQILFTTMGLDPTSKIKRGDFD